MRTVRLTIHVLAAGMAIAGIPGCGEHGDHGKHGGHTGGHAQPVLTVKTEPATIKPQEPVKYHLTIRDAAGATVKDFETVHEKKLHLIIVRDGLDRFAHVHPEVDRAGNITGTFTFAAAGKYRLYADYKPAGKKQASSIAEVSVAGTPAPSPALVPNIPGRVQTAELAADIRTAKTKDATRISFALFDAAGKPIADLQPYLGAMGHLVVLSADGSQYVHSHPLEEKSSGGSVAFDAHFPHPGIYKGWGQFQRSGKVHDVPFVVRIE